MFTLCYWFDQKTGNAFNGSFCFKIKFRQAQISVPKMGILMLKTVCINPWLQQQYLPVTMENPSSLSLCLQKKRPENWFLTLAVNYCQIVQKNKLGMP